jgi:hypothetical protein
VGTEAVIAVIEVLSPTNKRPGEGYNEYQARRRLLTSSTHLVEIDLLRQGEPMPILKMPVSSQYRILVSRSNLRPIEDFYPFNLPDPIPAFQLPLQQDDIEPIVDLQTLLHTLYDQGGYDLRIDYRQEAAVALSQTDADWAATLLHHQGLREQ